MPLRTLGPGGRCEDNHFSRSFRIGRNLETRVRLLW